MICPICNQQAEMVQLEQRYDHKSDVYRCTECGCFGTTTMWTVSMQLKKELEAWENHAEERIL